MKSGKTCSPSRRKPGESLFVRIEANLTGQQNFVVKHSSESRPSDDGGEFGLKIRGGGGHAGPSPGSATEIDLLGLYVFLLNADHVIFSREFAFFSIYKLCTYARVDKKAF